MLPNIVIGTIFGAIVIFAFMKVRSDAKNNKCSCGSSCSSKGKCHKG
ncbi:FeoB-associated Cys-rich membrane protein [Wukongibacter sp. M2B1]